MHQPRDEQGHFVSLRDYVALAIRELEKSVDKTFASNETTAEFKRASLATALAEAKATTDAALRAAAESVENKLIEAKTAADERGIVLQTRIEKLESGGAPFADRLNETTRKLQLEVEKLTTGAVKAEVVEALRDRQVEDAKAQKKQTRAALLAGGAALVLALIEAALRVFK